jgi:hypothetical protein
MMLRKIRIEVEEDSAEACVITLSKYEHAIQQQEAKRYQYLWPSDPEGHPAIEDNAWNIGVAARHFYNGELGREIVEEVIEYDPGLPGYRGRRVVTYNRIDTRHPVYTGDVQVTANANDEAVKLLSSMLPRG